ncbi:MAG: lipopolysaccharide transport periplasmic protein LptA [Mariprofundaceae bacterium]|nr:lipopolysaccharide transport periplasmic protein LptA [Mariprofundaceae bacterium]
MKLIRAVCLCLLINILGTGVVFAKDAVEIESEQMVVDHLKGEAEFKGGVHLVRGDFDLRCDRLLAYYQNNELKRAEAFGRVRMQHGTKRGASKRAVYDRNKNLITLLGEASVEDAEGVVRGEKIIHNIKTEHTEVMQGSDGRVHMSIESDDIKQGNTGQ